MIITISGKSGSGKSTVAQEIAKQLDLKHYSIGDLMRQMAKDRNMSLAELGAKAEKDDSIDKELDKKQIELKEKDDFVIDGRLTAFFLPNADVKVFLECDDKIRAERILRDERRDEQGKNINEVIKKFNERESSERKRYENYYNVDFYDDKLYELVIDTTDISVKDVVKKIMTFVDHNKHKR